MTKYDMCEAMCALPEGAVTMRRRSLVLPMIILFAGVALFVLNGLLDNSPELSNLKSAIVLFGAIFVLLGGAMSLIRLGKGGMAPWHIKEGCFLKKEELKFTKEDKLQVVDLLKRRDFATLRSISNGDISAVVVNIWSTPSGEFIAAQAFEYIDLELQPISDMSHKA